MPDIAHNHSRAGLGTVATFCALAVTVGGVTAAAATGSPRTAASTRTVLHFGVRFSPFRVIDVPPVATHPNDFQPGDYVVFSDVLTFPSGAVAGTEGGNGLITRVDRRGAQIAYTGTISLAHGQIAFQGLGSAAPVKRLVITGGSGSYLGARGDVVVIENRDNTGSLTVTLR